MIEKSKSLPAIILVLSTCCSLSASAQLHRANKNGKSNPTAVAPVKAQNAEQIEHGKKLFEKLTCAGCHPNGENTLHPYRPIKGPGFLARYKDDEQIEQLIRSGVPRAGMPAFAKAQVNDKDMKDLIAFIRSLTPQSAK